MNPHDEFDGAKHTFHLEYPTHPYAVAFHLCRLLLSSKTTVEFQSALGRDPLPAKLWLAGTAL